MMTMMKRYLALLMAAILLLGCIPLTLAEEAAEPAKVFETLKKGSRGDEVLRMKRRLRELGYFRTDELSNQFNDSTVKALKLFQSRNGLENNGVFDEATYQALYADQAVPATTPTPTPAPTPTPKPAPTPRPTPVVEYPERDGEGYLVGDGEFWYENDEDGMWMYMTDSLQIVITKQADESIPLEWFETDIRMRNGESFMSVETNPERPGTRFKYPFDIAVDNQFVLGFTDDFYGHRMYRKETVGVVIRDGEVLSSKTYKSSCTICPIWISWHSFRTERSRPMARRISARMNWWKWARSMCSALVRCSSPRGRSARCSNGMRPNRPDRRWA